jgi:uncharacterized membrane protein YphA (DoxX/SURF4 family)
MEADRKSKIFIEIVALLHIALFIYAAASKLLDYENFLIQLGQSPLLSAFTGWISWGVPVLEILIAVALAVPVARLLGLVASFLLMIMFSAYIFTVLHFSNYVPCGCGGILEDMKWEDHLLFNLAFVLLSAAAIVVHFISRNPSATLHITLKRPLAILFICTASGAGIVTAAHLASAEIIHHHNSFIRRFPNNPAKVREMDLQYNSYYFSGFENGQIYLGNYTAPSLITVIDTSLLKRATHKIIYPDSLPAYSSLNLQVLKDRFYIIDGTVPMVLTGAINDGKVTMAWQGTKQFSQASMVDSVSLVFRALGTKERTTLGRLNFNSPDVTLHPGLIKKQIDGVFDVDGLLQFDTTTGTVAYTYYYRNQYIVADTKLNLLRMGKTIDTVSKAVLKVAYVKSRHETKLAAPPLIVNRTSCADAGLLYVNSALRGRYEADAMWESATVIDVYEMKTGRYISSFYIYTINGKKLRSFVVKGSHLYALIGTTLVDYHLYDGLLKEALE